MIGALLSSFVLTAVYGSHQTKWEPFFYYGLMAVGLILLGLGQREEKRITIPHRPQIEVSF
jgi:hypothetical protein